MSRTKVERYSSVPSFVPRKRRPKAASAKVKSCGVATPAALNRRLMLPDDTEPLDNQVAGHMFEQGKSIGMLKHKDSYVLKPLTKPMCGDREMRFYEELQTTSDPVLQQLRHFVPVYHGTKCIPVNGEEVRCLVLDNATRGLKEPCIMDIKIGRRTWDPLATAEKIANENTKYVDSKRDVGFCIPGFQVRNLGDGKLYKFGKDYGKKLNRESVREALRLFLNADSGLCRPLLVQLLGLLWRILHWCRTQRKLRLYSSSLLLVYDARLLRQFVQAHGTVAPGPRTRPKRNRPPSLSLTDFSPNSPLLCPGFSGQLTAEGPRFDRPASCSQVAGTPTAPGTSGGCPWKRPVRKLQRTHSVCNNYEQDLQSLRQNYVYMLDELVDDSPHLWANVKMIDFAHVFPAEGNAVDANYLEGIEHLIGILEGFLQEAY